MQDITDQDRAILRALQEDADATAQQLAERTGLPAATCWRRIERMEAAGVIEKIEQQIDPRALGLEVEVSLRVTLDKTQTNAFDQFIDAAQAIKEVNEIQTFLGRVDVRLNVLARDIPHYQEIYRNQILGLPHIQDIEALMLVSTVFDQERLPI